MSAVSQPFRDAVAQGRERFLALQVRERWIVGGGAVTLLLVVLYLAVWDPVVGAHRTRAEALVAARATAGRLEGAAVKVQTSRLHSGAGVNRSVSLVGAIDQSSKQSGMGKGPTRVQPEGDKEVRVWFDDVGFDATMRWLADLQARYGVTVQTIDVEPQSEAGSVNVRLSLVRGS